MAWTELPAGDGITLAPGELLALVASVKASHSAADLQAFAAKRGLSVLDYAEEGQRAGLGPDPDAPGYRYVAATARAGQALSLPWSVPWPLSMVDSSSLVRAWKAPPSALAPVAPPAPAPAPLPEPKAPSLRPLAAIGFFAAVLYFWRRDRRRR